MSKWSLIYDDFDPGKEDLREALCTLGNGYFATRGAAAESEADDTHYPGTYLAGGYNRLKTEIAGRVIENEDLVNLPNWLPLTFRIDDGEWFDLKTVEILSYRQELDIKKGLLLRTVRFRDEKSRLVTMQNRRLVHMENHHYAAQETTLTAENWSGRIEVRSALDGRVINAGVERYNDLNGKHLEPLATEKLDEETIYLEVRTSQSRTRITQSAVTRIFKKGQYLPLERTTVRESGYIAQHFSLDIAEGESLTIEKIVALFTSGDRGISECGLSAREALKEVGSFENLLDSHVLAWGDLWRHFEFKFESNEDKGDRTPRILHLHIFHLLQTTSLHTKDLDVGVPSRGWHGEAYRGHIFWDELYIFPLLNFRIPAITKSLLMYRYRRLDAARKLARETGHHGAMYPWQSGSSGREESQQLHLNPRSGRWLPDNSHLQRHINAAIAYNLWQYYQVTGDKEFLSFYGAEMLFELARFWASASTYNAEAGRYEILGVMGPDEYHDAYPDSAKPGLNNNAYTNIMAVWVLSRALELFEILDEVICRGLCEKIKIGEDEKRLWRAITRKMKVPFHEDGIISQFEGYEHLHEFDWQGHREKHGDIQRLDRLLEAEDDTPNRYKASKQADVLMLFYLFSSEELQEIFEGLGYPFEYETIPKNIDYYNNRTSHGSTLSRVVHAWVLTRSDRARSWKFFLEALESDVADIQGGTTPEGIHLGAMAGAVDILDRAYTGLAVRNDVLWFNPVLPEEIGRLHIHIRYRGHSLEVDITGKKLQIRALACADGPVKIGFVDRVFELKMGKDLVFELSG
ncbi:MAG: glycoside hydrolase family 65 protein [Desulfurivibrionaceae bacterium]